MTGRALESFLDRPVARFYDLLAGSDTYVAAPSGVTADAVSARASSTTITVSSLNYTFGVEHIKGILQMRVGDMPLIHLDTRRFSVTGTTITVEDGAFAATDTFLVMLWGPKKQNESSDSLGSLVTGTNLDDGVASYTMVSLEGYRSHTLQVQVTNGTLLAYYTNNADADDESTDDWEQDSTIVVTDSEMVIRQNQKYRAILFVFTPSSATNSIKIDGYLYN